MFCDKQLTDLGYMEPDVRQEVCCAMLKGRQDRAEDKIEGQLDRVEKILSDACKAIQRIHGAYLHYTDIEDLDGHLPMEMLVRDIMDDLHEIVLEVKSFVLPKDKRKHDLL
ncbi:hypothetical protein SCHPADRAFT_897494 [Schizopora paradoxa]|uniref:Uncharacterized protein n=1 Tax=Schizopora paradoxa TaxID=27342 RepID=A0A0H2QX05_9AGAM|nr:hypothetical protein SCHPADRAFT_897494 [Schizopora paradoxa]